MSTTGMLFTTTGRYLDPGLDLEISIDWPALLNDDTPLQLSVVGRVVRVKGSQVAVRMTKREFRTRGHRESAQALNNEVFAAT